MSPMPEVEAHTPVGPQAGGDANDGWTKIGMIVRTIRFALVPSATGITGCTLRFY